MPAADGNILMLRLRDAAWSTPIRIYTSGYDALVAKLTYGNFAWNTFRGGSGSDQASTIAIDSSDGFRQSRSAICSEVMPLKIHNKMSILL
jgi:hypothetical protein